MKILFVINPVSGGTSNDKAILRIHEHAVAQGIDFKFFYTSAGDDTNAFQEQLSQYKPDRVVAGGGDGTLQFVASNLVGKKIPFAMLPLGSANGMATSLAIPSKDILAVDALFGELRTVSLDLLLINKKHICIHLADIGANASMVKEYAESGDHGMIRYAKHVVHAVKESPLIAYTIKTDVGVFEKEGYMLTFANAPMYGTGVKISDGSVSDGLFEICNVPGKTFKDMLKAGLTKFNVFLDKEMFSDVISCRHAEVILNQEADFQLDGEYMGKVSRLTIDIIPSAVNILIP